MFHARSVARPVLAIRLLKLSTFRTSLVGGAFVRLGVGATPFLLPLLLQVGLGWSPLKAGTVSIAQVIGVLAYKPVAPIIMRRWGFRSTMVWASVAVGFLIAAPGFFRADTPIALIVVLLAIGGFSRSVQFTAINTVAFADVPQSSVSRAVTLSTVMQQVSLSLGISFGALLLSLTHSGGGKLTPDRFTVPFMAIGLISMAAIPFYRSLAADAGSTISGHGR